MIYTKKTLHGERERYFVLNATQAHNHIRSAQECTNPKVALVKVIIASAANTKYEFKLLDNDVSAVEAKEGGGEATVH